MERPAFRSGFVMGYLNLALVFSVVLCGVGFSASWILYKPKLGTATLLLSCVPFVVGTLRELRRQSRRSKIGFQ